MTSTPNSTTCSICEAKRNESELAQCEVCLKFACYDSRIKSTALSVDKPCIPVDDYNILHWFQNNTSSMSRKFPAELISKIQFPKVCLSCSLVACQCCKKFIKYTEAIKSTDTMRYCKEYFIKCKPCAEKVECSACNSWYSEKQIAPCQECKKMVCDYCSTVCDRLDHGRLCKKEKFNGYDFPPTPSCFKTIHTCKKCNSTLHHGKKDMKPCTSMECREASSDSE